MGAKYNDCQKKATYKYMENHVYLRLNMSKQDGEFYKECAKQLGFTSVSGFFRAAADHYIQNQLHIKSHDVSELSE